MTPRDEDARTPIRELCERIGDDVGIRLEHEAEYDWIGFVPQRTSEAGALTKYFAKVHGADQYELRGIEARQRSTPPFIADVQRDLIRCLDETRDPAAICRRLQGHLADLRRGDVLSEELAITNRVSKRRQAYSQYTRNVAALERAVDFGVEKHPGEDVGYVVIDDSKSTRERVRLRHEANERFDEEFYADQTNQGRRERPFTTRVV